MSNLNLWEDLNKLKETCKWVDLSHEVSPETPHWFGFPSVKSSVLYDFEKDGFRAHTYEIVSQYGTHVDAPVHFVKGKRSLDTFKPDDMVMPLCVLDLSKEVSQNPDFTVTVDDKLAWEEKNGKIVEMTPLGAECCRDANWHMEKANKDLVVGLTDIEEDMFISILKKVLNTIE